MPQLTPPQWLAVAAVVAVAFWPKIRAFLEHLPSVPAAGKPKPVAGTSRAPLVSELLEMQDALRPVNAKAADLVGQAVVVLIGGTK